MRNKLILITGGSSGIGKAAASELHRQGARIILQARGLEKLIIVKEGLPDIIINSAGAGEWLSFEESTVSHYKDTMDSPYLATALSCKVFYDKMQERGSGHFIMINSAACYFSFPGATGYTPARWAMLGFAKSLQADLYHTDFKVSMIVFGKVDSPYFKNNPVSEERIPKIANWLTPTLSVETAGKVISKVVRKKSTLIIRPLMMSFFVFLNRLVPWMFTWLMRITSYK